MLGFLLEKSRSEVDNILSIMSIMSIIMVPFTSKDDTSVCEMSMESEEIAYRQYNIYDAYIVAGKMIFFVQ